MKSAGLLYSLAAGFNSLMGIKPGHFRSGTDTVAKGEGVQRARAREAAYRKAQAERLANAAPPVETRQQRRRAARIDRKANTMTPAQLAHLVSHKMGLPDYPRSTFVSYLPST